VPRAVAASAARAEAHAAAPPAASRQTAGKAKPRDKAPLPPPARLRRSRPAQQEELAMRGSSHSVSPTGAVVLGLALLFASLPASRLAAQLLNAPNDNLPLQVQADSGIEWQQNNQLYIARGMPSPHPRPSEVHATP